ncbi:MAG: hypothetical protein ACNA7I_05680 [Candidatus Methanoperedens sp.]
MSIVTAISNVNTPLPIEIISQGGVIAAVSLVISLSIGLLVSDSRYWNSWTSSTLNICTISLLITFAATVFLKVITIL